MIYKLRLDCLIMDFILFFKQEQTTKCTRRHNFCYPMEKKIIKQYKTLVVFILLYSCGNLKECTKNTKGSDCATILDAQF